MKQQLLSTLKANPLAFGLLSFAAALSYGLIQLHAVMQANGLLG
jgi:hypothetical protein